MRTPKASSQAPLPPPYSPSTSQPLQTRASIAQERTPLIPSAPRNQHQYTYTYTPPSSNSPNANQDSNPPRYHPFIYRPLFRTRVNRTTNRPRSLANKVCRVFLLSLLGIAILATICKSYFLFLPFHPPGINLPIPGKAIAPLRIAVIGAGPAGVGAALRLSEVLSVVGRDEDRDEGKDEGKVEERQVELVIFDRNQRVGGRMAFSIGDGLGRWEIEDVASADLFADPEGKLRKRAESVLGLSFADEVEETREKVEDVGFLTAGGFSNWLPRPRSQMPWTQWVRFFLRYGNSVVTARNVPTGTMRLFNEMVRMSDDHVFEGVEEWIKKAKLRDSVEMSARERLKVNGVGNAYRNDIIESQVRRQLGQGTQEISDLALSLALAREDMGSSRTTNGIKMETVLKQLLERSKAEIRLETSLTSLKQEFDAWKKEWVWRLGFFDGATSTSEVFDKVVLTIPWGKSEEGYYCPVINTIVVSTNGLNSEFFNAKDEDDIPSQILPVQNSDLPVEIQSIHEISHVKDIFGPDVDLGVKSVLKMYRVLSDTALSEQTMRSLWGDGLVKSHAVVSAQAYPLLFPRNEDFGQFMIDEGLYSTASIEKVASSVDLSWAAGENVANLIKRDME